jgi:hypothetical protein
MKAANNKKTRANQKKQSSHCARLVWERQQNKRTRAGTPRGKEHRSLCAKRCSTAATCPWCWASTDFFFYMVEKHALDATWFSTHAETSQRLSIKNVQRIFLRTHICMSLQRLFYFLFPGKVCVRVCACALGPLCSAHHTCLRWSFIYNYITRV